jgi:probable phosphoglycerate mutase
VITAYFDGGARGNPGPAGWGVHIVDGQGAVLARLHGALGTATNNQAEYRGLIAALRWAADHDVTRLRVRGDSELLIEQMRGNYRVKNAGLKPLHAEARLLVMQIGDVAFEHIPREQNREADRLSNLGMDASVGTGGTGGPGKTDR